MHSRGEMKTLVPPHTQQVLSTGTPGLELPQPASKHAQRHIPKMFLSPPVSPLAGPLSLRWEKSFWGGLGAVGSTEEGGAHKDTLLSLNSSDHLKRAENIPGIWVGP